MLRAALIALALVACGDDLPSGIDAGIPVDARDFADAALVACGDDAACVDPRRPVCDVDRGVCAECAVDADCQRPDALGPRCRADGACVCQGDDDCDGRPSGPACHATADACTCRIDDDCAGETTCELDPYLGVGVRTCAPPT